MNFKDIRLELKNVSDTGSFDGYAAAFGNEDLGGDVIEPGAFTKTLLENPSRPLLWNHLTSEPIGIVKDIGEDRKGLGVKGSLNLDVQRAREAYSLIKQGAVKGLSIGYDAIRKDFKDGVRYLKELKLYEVSLVPFPMNPEAGVTAVKAVQYLVSGPDGDHLPYTDAAGNPDHRLMGAAWAALHGGYRGNTYQGPDKAAAIAKLRRIYHDEGMKAPDETGKAALIESIDQSIERLSALRAALAPEAAKQDDIAPEILHASSERIDSISKLLRGEL